MAFFHGHFFSYPTLRSMFVHFDTRSQRLHIQSNFYTQTKFNITYIMFIETPPGCHILKVKQPLPETEWLPRQLCATLTAPSPTRIHPYVRRYHKRIEKSRITDGFGNAMHVAVVVIRRLEKMVIEVGTCVLVSRMSTQSMHP